MHLSDIEFVLLQGGPGGILLTLDGQITDLNQWKCNKLNSRGQSPEEVYPGVLDLDFDDSNWGRPVVSSHKYLCKLYGYSK